MNWHALSIAPEGTHHVFEGNPAYAARFDEIMKFHPPGLAPVRRDGAAWHIRPDGSPAYPTRFVRVFGFYESVAAVVAHDGWHHIRPDGTTLFPHRYAWCGNFQDGRCPVREVQGSYFHVAPDGTPAYRARWRYAGDYRDGTAVVQDESGRSTHIAVDGEKVHDRWFVDLDVFHKGFARARDADGWMHIDRDGVPAYGRRFAAVEPFYNGQARVERFDGGLEVIDETGTMLVELRPALRSEFAALSADMVGFWRTQCIAAAVELGVVEALPGSSAEIAQRRELDPDRTQLLLRAMAELSLVREENCVWYATSRGGHLLKSAPLTLADAALEYGHHFPRLWETLPQALRDGAWSRPEIFAAVASDDSRRESHHRMLRSYARHDYGDVPGALRLRGDEAVVDAGGGLGVLSELLVAAYPNVRVTMLDLPEVVDLAKTLGSSSARIAYCAADLFSTWPVAGDAVVLARVLHDWDDADAVRILKRAREAVEVGAHLFVVEMLLPEHGNAGSLCGLHLLVATGGRERSQTEYGELMSAAGFELKEVRRIPALPSVLVGVAR